MKRIKNLGLALVVSLAYSLGCLADTNVVTNALIDVDFGGGLASSAKTGFAAVGKTASDFWNWYTRDDGVGGYRTFGVVSNLKYVEGDSSGAGMTVQNAPGAWGTGSADPMYYDYLYPFSGNATVTVTNLPAGGYDVYLYSADGNVQASVEGTDYGVKSCVDATGSNPPNWQEGSQYVVYRGVPVAGGQALTLTIRPGVYGYAIFAGLQLVQTAGGVPDSAPSITTQPASQTVLAGADVTFSVSAAGTAPLSYQWRYNGTDLDGATGVSLTVTNVQLAAAGSYSVSVTNLVGAVVSSDAVLTVVEPGTNGLIAVDFGGGLASSAKTGFAAVGQTASDYWNWYTRDDGAGGWRSAGAVTDLKYVNGMGSGAGLVVLNAPGAWGTGSADPMYYDYLYPFSGNATVTVTNLPAGGYDVYLYSADGNVQASVEGTDYGVKSCVDATGSNPPNWQEGSQYVVYRGVPVAGGQALTLTIRPGVYGYAIFAGLQLVQTAGGVPDSAPSITTQPASQTVLAGADVTFSVSAAGTAPLSYQWRYNGTDLDGATGVSLTVTNVQLAAAGSYSVSVTNLVGAVVSSDAVLTVVEPGTNGLIAVDFGGGLASSAKTGFAAVGQTASDYWNWYTRDDGAGGWRSAGAVTDLKYVNGMGSGAGLVVLNAPGAWGTGSADPMYYDYLYPFSGNATVTVTNLPAGGYDVYLYSADGNVQASVEGTDYGVKSCVDATGSNPPNWQEGSQYVVYRGVPVAGGQALTLTIRPGVYGYAIFAGLQLVQTAGGVPDSAPSITTQPASQTVLAGADVTFSVSAAGTAPLSYQWRYNGTDLDGATGVSLTVTNVQLAAAGSYSVSVTNLVGAVVSSDAVLTVVEPGTNGLIAVDFGGGLASSAKTGFAAVGQTASDYWNWYTRDDGAGGWRSAGAVTDLKYVNGMGSGAGLVVLNAPGAWGTGSADPMYYDYLYPFSGNATVTVTNLPAGGYDVYLYSADGNVQASVEGTDYGVKSCVDATGSNPPNWQEGSQYVVYRGVPVAGGQALTLTIRPGVYGYAIFAGLQLVQTAAETNGPSVARIIGSPLAEISGLTNLVIAPACDHALVVLDGSQSRGPANYPLSYLWQEGTRTLGSGARLTNQFEIGTHQITLAINDGQDGKMASATFEVVTPAQSIGILVALLEEAQLGLRTMRPLVSSLKNAADSFEQCSPRTGVIQLKTFQNKVRAQIAPFDAVQAQQWVDFAQQVINATSVSAQ